MGKAQEAQPMETAAHGSRRPPTPFRPRGSGAPYRPLPPFFFHFLSLSLFLLTLPFWLFYFSPYFFFTSLSLFCSYSFSTVFTSGCLLRFFRRFFRFFFRYFLSLSLFLCLYWHWPGANVMGWVLRVGCHTQNSRNEKKPGLNWVASKIRATGSETG